MQLTVQSKFINALPPDPEKNNQPRKVFHSGYSFVSPTPATNPKCLHINQELANTLGISLQDTQSNMFLEIFSGSKIYPNTQPYAMCYGGHQFGVWAGQLGDGRAINLFEIEHNKQSFSLQLKGAGKTPYSRNADGLAVLRSSIREYLCAEAMHHLNIPTTRSLSLISSGKQVLRDPLYNGNPQYEPGAIVCRTAPSFIRFGNFEIFATRNDIQNLKKLADFTIKEHFPEIKETGKKKYLLFFKTVAQATLNMIINWQRVGFIHGVMNTDNMSIHGITLDYGPYGWLENYNPNWTPNTTDTQNRYAFEKQPEISHWNLYQLANALYPLINETQELENLLHSYEQQYEQQYLNMMRNKMGLLTKNQNDQALIQQLLPLLYQSETDYTLFFRQLALINTTHTATTALPLISTAFYNHNTLKTNLLPQWETWLTNYINRLLIDNQPNPNRVKIMNTTNPKYILRNYMLHLAIEKANQGDTSLINTFYQLLQKPYDEQPNMEQWFAKRPNWAKTTIGCSQLSCSS